MDNKKVIFENKVIKAIDKILLKDYNLSVKIYDRNVKKDKKLHYLRNFCHELMFENDINYIRLKEICNYKTHSTVFLNLKKFRDELSINKHLKVEYTIFKNKINELL